MQDGTVGSRVGPLVGRVRAVLACTDLNGRTDPTGHPRENRPVRTARVCGSRLLRDLQRWLWWSFCEKSLELIRIALQGLEKTEHAQEQTRLGKFRVGRHNGGSRWYFAARSVAPDS
ncbi:hypothetical protein CRG98_043644 [Punica granatum]|uniref:Uncharacterized protein n=1 Tax=Punica granatum TaxID=22663 RepID=A0A2I0HW99_PUNGR|nr:hypothetical protein CRG98_043644 [Punica granatum]